MFPNVLMWIFPALVKLKKTLNNLNEALELYFEDVKNPQVNPIQRPQIVGFPFSYA